MMTNDLIELLMVVITLRYDDDYYGSSEDGDDKYNDAKTVAW